jgi:hypothetical protein
VVVDLQTPAHEICSIQMPITNYMKGIDNMLFLKNGTKVMIYDMTDPTDPIFIEEYDTGINFILIKYYDGYIYITDGYQTKIFTML